MGKASRRKKTRRILTGIENGDVARVWQCEAGCEHWNYQNDKECLLGSDPSECGHGFVNIEASLELNEYRLEKIA
jgi:hypothetical protein